MPKKYNADKELARIDARVEFGEKFFLGWLSFVLILNLAIGQWIIAIITFLHVLLWRFSFLLGHTAAQGERARILSGWLEVIDKYVDSSGKVEMRDSEKLLADSLLDYNPPPVVPTWLKRPFLAVWKKIKK